jgi:hypothetical protein
MMLAWHHVRFVFFSHFPCWFALLLMGRIFSVLFGFYDTLVSRYGQPPQNVRENAAGNKCDDDDDER